MKIRFLIVSLLFISGCTNVGCTNVENSPYCKMSKEQADIEYANCKGSKKSKIAVWLDKKSCEYILTIGRCNAIKDKCFKTCNSKPETCFTCEEKTDFSYPCMFKCLRANKLCLGR